MEVSRLCGFCNRSIRGRTDKKFCSDKCRNNCNYSLRTKHSARAEIRKINRKLIRNRLILEGLYTKGSLKVGLDVLESLGFDFSLHTTTRLVPDQGKCFFCYDMGYRIEADTAHLLLRHSIFEDFKAAD